MLLREWRHPLNTGKASCNRGWPCTESVDLVSWMAWAKRVELSSLFITHFKSFASWSENELEPNPTAVSEKSPAYFWNLQLLRVPMFTSFGPQIIPLTSGKYLKALLNPLGAHRDQASKLVWQWSDDSSKCSKVMGKARVLLCNRNDSTEAKWVSTIWEWI